MRPFHEIISDFINPLSKTGYPSRTQVKFATFTKNLHHDTGLRGKTPPFF